MQTIIINKLSDIQREYGIDILFACESGSRGWQFPSPDSDYDVRFIYSRPIEAYLSVAERDDQIGFPINDELDVYGWDIRKVLQLLRKSNTTPFEWLQSPIVYMRQQGFRDELWELCQQYFDRRSNIHHYLGIARGALETVVNNDEIKIKKLFYVLRPLLAAKWCLEKNAIAPMSIKPLMTLMPDGLQQLMLELIDRKSTAPEGYIIKIKPELQQYIDHEFDICTQASSEMPKMSFDVEPLDIFFRKIIKP
ncbi:MAG: nucleotidyltransferase domain-containing protein [Bacteroidales bacterium]|jgi:predicted nucleotidyltransferase|nr:nucleotidyltransferase domain-containing protein [Bacteroidales bacterium]